MKLLTVLSFLLLTLTGQARYVSCKKISCDCDHINAGILNVGWIPECKKKEEKLKTACQAQGHWTSSVGYCGPEPYGKMAFPVNQDSSAISAAANEVVQGPRPMKLIYTLLPGFGTGPNATNAERIFAEVNDEFSLSAMTLWDLWKTADVMITEGTRDTFLNIEVQRFLIAQLKSANDNLLQIQERYQNKVSPLQNIYDLLPPQMQDLNIPENMNRIEDLRTFINQLDQWNELIFNLYKETFDVYKNAFETQTSRLNLERAKSLNIIAQEILAQNPWNQPAGLRVQDFLKTLLPNLGNIIEYSFSGFQLR